MDIFQAIEDGDLEEVMLFLEEGGNIEEAGAGGRTLLMNAILMNQFEITTAFIENGANVNARTNADRTALMFACQKNSLKVVELLLEKGADVNVVSRLNSATALKYAYEHHNFQIAKRLLKKKASFTSSLRDTYRTATLPMFLLAATRKQSFTSDDHKFLSQREFKANLGKYTL